MATPRESNGTSSILGSEDPRIVALLHEYLAALEQGRRPDRGTYRSRFPDLAGVLDDALAGLEFLHAAAPSDQKNPKPLLPAADDDDRPNLPLGDYRLLREIGRGGMGVVYEAEQLSLGRRVALKVLPLAASFDSKQLHRFRNEAMAAARLHHPNIVPVFAVGCDRGVHYYAMQYIEGRTLADLIADLWAQEFPGARNPKDASPARTHGPRRRGQSWVQLAPTRDAYENLPPTCGYEPGAEADAADRIHLDAADPAAAVTPTKSTDIRTTKRSARGKEHYRALARLALQAAEALEYAHGMGIVHRDIKPANLLLDPHGNLWVTDFGLAQFQSGADLTLSGDLLGTIRYMSPEQAQGQRGRVDYRTDIYSLGVTLYELLTLRHAFAGSDRDEVLRQILHADPRPLRRVRRGVPEELEIIVLKAMAKNPSERYGSAQDLADDLRRFLNDQPIRARRPSLAQVVSKWTRRHQAVVVTSLAVAILCVIVLSWALVIVYEEKQRTKAALEDQKRSRLLARAVIEDLSGWVAKELDKNPSWRETQRAFQEKALEHYERFARQSGDDPDLRHERAWAYLRVADAQNKLGRVDRAEVAYGQALPLFERLAKQFPDTASYWAGLAQCRSHRALLLDKTGRYEIALPVFREAIAAAENAVAHGPEDPSHTKHLGIYYGNLGSVLMNAGRFAEAEPPLLKAVKTFERMVKVIPGCWWFRHRLAVARLNAGALFYHMGRHDDAEAYWTKSEAVLRPLADSLPTEAEVREDLAEVYNHLGALCHASGRNGDAEKHFTAFLNVCEKLRSDHPNVYQYKLSVAQAQYNLGTLWKADNRIAEAETALRKALRTQSRLATAHPKMIGTRRALVRTVCNLANVLKDADRLTEAEDLYRQSIQLADAVLADFDASPDDREHQANSYNNFGRFLLEGKRYQEAEPYLRRAVKLLEQLTTDYPDREAYRTKLAKVREHLDEWMSLSGVTSSK